ncbi:hypothetical protein HPP92_024898 [Vanilla planifolia]|uniref:Uncharacterized protein n=1 Tax=Vanilla planifolia TaxID=51239 RepID=A0A835U8I1_VANPL|nr:hypothetical protein HPP92_024898 [Vanilla planifolia]
MGSRRARAEEEGLAATVVGKSPLWNEGGDAAKASFEEDGAAVEEDAGGLGTKAAAAGEGVPEVDFPAPLGPTMARISHGFARR